MKFTQKLPDEGINISKGNILLDTSKFLFSFILLLVVVYFSLLGLANLIINNLTYEQEKKLLSFISFDIQFEEKQSNQKLNKILNELKKCTSLKEELKVGVVESDIENAFALPGGTIVVTTELLKNVKDDNELYFVLGHELGHYINKDHLKRFGNSIVLIALNLILPSDLNFLTDTTLQLNTYSYSKEQEIKADESALSLMYCSLNNVNHATDFFKRLNERNNSSKLSDIFSTHPHPEKRIENIERIVEEINKKIKNKN